MYKFHRLVYLFKINLKKESGDNLRFFKNFLLIFALMGKFLALYSPPRKACSLQNAGPSVYCFFVCIVDAISAIIDLIIS